MESLQREGEWVAAALSLSAHFVCSPTMAWLPISSTSRSYLFMFYTLWGERLRAAGCESERESCVPLQHMCPLYVRTWKSNLILRSLLPSCKLNWTVSLSHAVQQHTTLQRNRREKKVALLSWFVVSWRQRMHIKIIKIHAAVYSTLWDQKNNFSWTSVYKRLLSAQWKNILALNYLLALCKLIPKIISSHAFCLRNVFNKDHFILNRVLRLINKNPDV